MGEGVVMGTNAPGGRPAFVEGASLAGDIPALSLPDFIRSSGQRGVTLPKT